MAITIRLIGGLGNQLFQYSAGRAASLRSNSLLRLDASLLNQDIPGIVKRNFGLDNFNIQAKIDSNPEISDKRFLSNIANRLFAKWVNLQTKIHERFGGVYLDPRIIKPKKNKDIVMFGYWMSELYFKEFEDIIRKDLSLKKLPNQKFKKMSSMMNSKKYKSISVHIRRGDFIDNPRSNAFNVILTSKYYKEALEKIIESAGKAKYRAFVFSDDISWVKKNISLGIPTIYVSKPSLKDYEELILMSFCDHHIIANSSFSWWGAWLNPKKDKVVVSPKSWFKTISSSNILPEEWIKLEVI